MPLISAKEVSKKQGNKEVIVYPEIIKGYKTFCFDVIYKEKNGLGKYQKTEFKKTIISKFATKNKVHKQKEEKIEEGHKKLCYKIDDKDIGKFIKFNITVEDILIDPYFNSTDSYAIGIYHFDNDTIHYSWDSSIYQNHLHCDTVNCPNIISEGKNKSRYYNGYNDYLIFDTPMPLFSDFTIEFLVNTEINGMAILGNLSGDEVNTIILKPRLNLIHIEPSYAATGDCHNNSVYFAPFELNTTYFFSMVFHEPWLDLYVNGTFVNSSCIGDIAFYGFEMLGGRIFEDNFFRGMIDEVYFYDSILSAEDIMQDFIYVNSTISTTTTTIGTTKLVLHSGGNENNYNVRVCNINNSCDDYRFGETFDLMSNQDYYFHTIFSPLVNESDAIPDKFAEFKEYLFDYNRMISIIILSFVLITVFMIITFLLGGPAK